MRLLIAGAGGVLGRELVDVLYRQGAEIIGLSCKECEFLIIKEKLLKFICCDVTKPIQLEGICEGIDIVISVLGITRLKGKLTHMDVDYQGNLNLLKEAKKRGVKKFVFISPVGVEKGHKYVPLFKAKYLFEEVLKQSGIDWLIFRAGAFYRDLAEVGRMAQKGFMIIFGKGNNKFTPIDVRELAEIMIKDTLNEKNKIIEVGGPEDLCWSQVCKHCFKVFGKRPLIINVPIRLAKFMAATIKPFSQKYYSIARLIIFTSSTDLLTPKKRKVYFSEYLRENFLKENDLK